MKKKCKDCKKLKARIKELESQLGLWKYTHNSGIAEDAKVTMAVGNTGEYTTYTITGDGELESN